MLTEKKVLQHFRKLMMESPVAAMIGGSVYLKGMRPRDSKNEDAVVIFTGGLPGQVEMGVVAYNIYVPDIDPDDNGTYVENAARTAALEAAAADWVEALEASQDDYLIRAADAVHTAEMAEKNQHFVVVKLNYKYLNE